MLCAFATFGGMEWHCGSSQRCRNIHSSNSYHREVEYFVSQEDWSGYCVFRGYPVSVDLVIRMRCISLLTIWFPKVQSVPAQYHFIINRLH